MRRNASLVLALVLFVSLSVPASAEDYCFGFLMANPQRPTLPETQVAEIQQGHLAHMDAMAKAGKLLAAGPLGKSESMRGIVIYRCTALDEAAAFTEPDPAVSNQRLRTIFQTWRGPNDVGEPLTSMLKRDPNSKYTMVTLPFLLLRRTSKWEQDPSLKTMRKEQDFLNKLRRRKVLRLDGAFLGQPDRPYEGAEPGALLILAAMPLNEAVDIAKNHPLVEQGYATIEALEWYVADEAIPLP
ncbi:MAG: YciI family protein [Bryobacterales bacterium]|nr:YciI family protein [Bryobacterales bacterium]